MLVLRGELGDMAYGGPPTGVNPRALGSAIDSAATEGRRVTSLWTSGGRVDRFHMYVEENDVEHTWVVDGAGIVMGDATHGMVALLDQLGEFHEHLMLGDPGGLLVITAGIGLMALTIIGVAISWPALLSSRRTLLPGGQMTAPAWSLSWHRALGLWLAPLGFVVGLTGVLLANADALRDLLDVSVLPPQHPPAHEAGVAIGTGDALAFALERYPGARLTAITMPGTDAPWYRIRLNAPGETRKVYGATTLFVAIDGALLREYDARSSAASRAFTESLYALHAGQIAGWPGRLLVGLVGLWLLAMVALGFSRFITRRR